MPVCMRRTFRLLALRLEVEAFRGHFRGRASHAVGVEFRGRLILRKQVVGKRTNEQRWLDVVWGRSLARTFRFGVVEYRLLRQRLEGTLLAERTKSSQCLPTLFVRTHCTSSPMPWCKGFVRSLAGHRQGASGRSRPGRRMGRDFVRSHASLGGIDGQGLTEVIARPRPRLPGYYPAGVAAEASAVLWLCAVAGRWAEARAEAWHGRASARSASTAGAGAAGWFKLWAMT